MNIELYISFDCCSLESTLLQRLSAIKVELELEIWQLELNVTVCMPYNI